MDKAEAKRRFDKADKLFTYGRFEDVMAELDVLDQHYPDNHRILNARARTLEQLGRFDEALAVCDRLLNEFQYEKIRAFRDGVAHSLHHHGAAPQKAFWGNETDAEPPPLPSTNPFGPSGAADKRSALKKAPAAKKRTRKILIRIILLFALAGLMYFGYLPYWLGGGIIGAYALLVLVAFVVKQALKKLFMAPFKMKGKALAGAACQLHGVQWTEKPANLQNDNEEEEEEEEAPRAPGRFAWLDVTITPQPNPGGFTHWEPGELMLAPAAMQLKGLDSLDECFPVHDFKLGDSAAPAGGDEDEDASKFAGPLRLQLLVEVPHHENAFKFVYYFEQFGNLQLA